MMKISRISLGLLLLLSISSIVSCTENEGNDIESRRKALHQYILELNIDWECGWNLDSNFLKNTKGDKYTIRTLDTLENMGCVVYKIESELINFLVLGSQKTGRFYSLFLFPDENEASKFLSNDELFYNYTNRNLIGLEEFFNNDILDVLDVKDIELKELLVLYNKTEFNPNRLINSIREIDKEQYSDKDLALLNVLFSKTVENPNHHKRKVVRNLVYKRHFGFVVVVIFLEDLPCLQKPRIKVWVHDVNKIRIDKWANWPH